MNASLSGTKGTTTVGTDVGALWRSVGLVLGFVLLITAGAQVRVPLPFTDVPMTLQLLAVMITGYLLRPMLAAATLVIYLGCGVAGLPIFAGVGGLVGPTAGYLVGFLVCAWLISVLRGRDDAGVVRLSLAGIGGATAVLAMGAAWRYLAAGFLGLPNQTLVVVMKASLVPFIPKALIEIGVAVALLRAIRGWRSHRPVRSGSPG